MAIKMRDLMNNLNETNKVIDFNWCQCVQWMRAKIWADKKRFSAFAFTFQSEKLFVSWAAVENVFLQNNDLKENHIESLEESTCILKKKTHSM